MGILTPLDSEPVDVLVCEFFLELGPEWFSTTIGGGAGRSIASARKDGLRGARTFDSDEWIFNNHHEDQMVLLYVLFNVSSSKRNNNTLDGAS